MVGGPGVRLMVSLFASMILDVACWGERNEVSRDAWKTPVNCKSTGPLVKLRNRLMQFPNELIARRRWRSFLEIILLLILMWRRIVYCEGSWSVRWFMSICRAMVWFSSGEECSAWSEMQRWSERPKMGSDVLFVMQTCLIAFLRRSPYSESLEMTIPRRGLIGPMGGVEELLCLVGLLNLTFFIPMRLPMSKRETNFFDSSGGNGWCGGRVA
jgi:hypothetical protein